MLDEPGLTGAPPIGAGDIVADRYEVLREVGRGGYAIVYEAHDRQTDRTLALKTIRPVAPRPQEVVARFRREVALVSKLKHPNTVRVYDWGFDDELYLAMELLEGIALADVLDGVHGIEAHRAVAIVRGVLESLSEAHEYGIVHRDLKPENVFLCHHEDGRETVKVLDFGIAKVIGFSDEEMNQPVLTLQGRAMGTPTYMSPEQARGAELTTQSDIYAVAVLLYELLCGTPPFDGEGAMDIMLQHVNAPVPELTVRKLRGTVIDRAIRKALSKKPEDRFATAGDFLAALGGTAVRGPQVAPVAHALPPDDPRRPKTAKVEAIQQARRARGEIRTDEEDHIATSPVQMPPSRVEPASGVGAPSDPVRAPQRPRPTAGQVGESARSREARRPGGSTLPGVGTVKHEGTDISLDAGPISSGSDAPLHATSTSKPPRTSPRTALRPAASDDPNRFSEASDEALGAQRSAEPLVRPAQAAKRPNTAKSATSSTQQSGQRFLIAVTLFVALLGGALVFFFSC